MPSRPVRRKSRLYDHDIGPLLNDGKRDHITASCCEVGRYSEGRQEWHEAMGERQNELWQAALDFLDALKHTVLHDVWALLMRAPFFDATDG